LQASGNDVLQHLAALQRSLTEVALENGAEQPSRGAQALLVLERLAAERNQLPPPVGVLVLHAVRGGPRSQLRVVQILTFGTQRRAGFDVVIELEPIAERAEKPKLEQPKRARHVRRCGQM